MTIDLPPDLVRFIEEQVACGEAPNANALVIDALQVLQDIRETDPHEMDLLRREIMLGCEGPGGVEEPWDPEEIKAEGRRLLAAKSKKHKVG